MLRDARVWIVKRLKRMKRLVRLKIENLCLL